MAFVNEYATDEDIEKYGLNDIWDRYMARRNRPRFYGRRPELTIDRENDVVMLLKGTGRAEGGTQYAFVLVIRGQVAIVYLNLVAGSSKSLEDNPFNRVWDWVLIEKESGSKLEDAELIELTKKAVTAYGYSGLQKQIPNTVVKFNF